jgi:hypothetical protein
MAKRTITPTPGKKRGRVLRTVETGREISHEEVVLGLIKRTAEALAVSGACACGSPILYKGKGSPRRRCLACDNKHRRRRLRERYQAASPTGERSVPIGEAVAEANRRYERANERRRQKRAAAVSAGMCKHCYAQRCAVGKLCAQCYEVQLARKRAAYSRKHHGVKNT